MNLNTSEKIISLFIVLFLLLIITALFLNNLIVKNYTVEEFVKEISTTQKGTQEVVVTDNIKKITYNWKYDSTKYSVTINLFNETYEKYLKQKRIPSRDWTYYSKNWFNQSNEVEILSNQLLFLSKEKKFSKTETIEFIASFVQSLRSINDTDDYPKFPYETLYDLGGDCEDLSILLAKFLTLAGITNAIIEFDDHVGIGVAVNETIAGTYFKDKQNTYYYLESTSPQSKLGQILPKLKKSNIKIYQSNLDTLIYPEYKIFLITENNDSFYEIKLNLTNYGFKPANFTLKVAVENDVKSSEEIIDNIEINDNEILTKTIILPLYLSQHRFRIEIKGKEINDISLVTKWV